MDDDVQQWSFCHDALYTSDPNIFIFADSESFGVARVVNTRRQTILLFRTLWCVMGNDLQVRYELLQRHVDQQRRVADNDIQHWLFIMTGQTLLIKIYLICVV